MDCYTYTYITFCSVLGVKRTAEISEIPVQNTGYDGFCMKAQLPFSWLIKEKIDEILTQASFGIGGLFT